MTKQEILDLLPLFEREKADKIITQAIASGWTELKLVHSKDIKPALRYLVGKHPVGSIQYLDIFFSVAMD